MGKQLLDSVGHSVVEMEALELSPTVIKAVGIGRIGGIGARIQVELGSNGQDCNWFDAGGGDFN